jgi:hypothetical protein
MPTLMPQTTSVHYERKRVEVKRRESDSEEAVARGVGSER